MKKTVGSLFGLNRRNFVLLSLVLSLVGFGLVALKTGAQNGGTGVTNAEAPSAAPPCAYFNNSSGSLPTGDGTVFDFETSGNQTKSWTHNFTLPGGATITSATLAVPEYFSDSSVSTINIDGAVSSFTPNGFSTCSGVVKIQTFNVAPASLVDGQLNVTMLENGDDIALDYSKLTINYTVSGTPFTAVSLVGDEDNFGFGGGAATAPVVTAPTPQTANEGASTTFNVGSFVDPDGGPWTAVVNWGDATTNTTFSASAAGSLGTQAHTYVQNGTYTGSINVTDGGALFDTKPFTITVANVAPTVTNVAVTPTINEGGTAHLTGTISDPGTLDSFTMVVNWGEGSPVTYTFPAGATSFDVTHQYLDDGASPGNGTTFDNYAVSIVSFVDSDGGAANTSAGTGGNIYLTGHDIQLHGRQNGYDVVILDYLRATIPRASYRIGYVRTIDRGAPGGGLFGTVTEATPASFASGADFATFLSGVDVLYIPWQPDIGSAGSATLNSFAPQIQDFINAGGDLIAESNVGDPTFYNFLPPGVAAGGSSIGGSSGFLATTEGLAIGIQSNMINGFPTHNRFDSYDSHFTVFETHTSGATTEVISIGISNATVSGGGLGTGLSVRVNNVAPSSVALNLTSSTINENGSTSLSGSFTDPGTLDAHTVTINWGDGSTNTTIPLSAGETAIPSTAHTYLDDNPTGTASDVYTITVTVADDDTGSASGTTAVTVNNVAPTATFTNGGPYVFGQPGAVSFSGQADPSASDLASLRYSYDFNNDGTFEIGNGTYAGSVASATAVVPPPGPPGNYTVRGRVIDDDTGFTDYTTVIVVQKANTTTTVTASPASPSVFGQSVTFTATVAVVSPGAGTPTGTVTFNIDGNLYCVNTPLTAGLTAQCTQAGLPALGAGLRNVVAIYSGNANFNGSAGTLNYTVNKADTITTITGDTPDPTIIGQPYAVTWTVVPNPVQVNSGSPTGTVTVSDGTGGTCTAPVAAGTCNVTSTTMGVKNLTATYSGDANFNGSVSTIPVSHTVDLQITGTIRNGLTLAPISNVSVSLIQLPGATTITTATTNVSGVFTFAGQYTGSVRVRPTTANPPYYDPLYRDYVLAGNNITGADFLSYSNAGDIPRTIAHTTQYVVPGASGVMPVILNSLNNEVSVSYSIIYDINPFAAPPTFVCGANAPLCTITQNNTVFGRVGVTVAPAGGAFTRPNGMPLKGPEAAGPKEIAKINFQTLATALPSTDFTIATIPVDTVTLDAAGNPLLTAYIVPIRVVFVQGIEGDVAGRFAGSGMVDSSDVVQVRRFVTGLDIPVSTHNEFQRADVAPASTKGNGFLDSTDVIETRRYAAGLDTSTSAGGAGAANPAPAAPAPEAAVAGSREVKIGSSNASTNSRVSIPVDLTANGDEIAASFTVRYDETRLTAPRVDLAKDAPEGMTLTVNTTEPGLIRVLVDSTTAIGRNSKDASSLVNITFDVTRSAASGDTTVELDELVISDAEARSLTTRATSGIISISGSNPTDSKGDKLIRRPTAPRVEMIEEWLNPSTIILRPRSEQ